MDIIYLASFQLLLTWLLLRISGEIGKLSIPFGYASLSRIHSSGNLSFNLIYRFLYIPISLSIIAIPIYFLHLDFLTKNIWLVAVWYAILQILYSLNKIKYTQIKLFFLSIIISIGLSYYVYVFGILQGLDFILPEKDNFRTELWFIIIIFFYEIIKKYENTDDTDDFSDKLTNQYLELKKKFGSVMAPEFQKNKFLNDLLYAIMIYEEMNRPRWMRFFENIFFKFGLAKTTGIMQIRSSVPLTDEESIRQGQKIIMDAYLKNEGLLESYQRFELVGKIATVYNPDAYYREEIRDLFNRVEFVSDFLEGGKFEPSEVRINEDLPRSVSGLNIDLVQDAEKEIKKLVQELNKTPDLSFELIIKDKVVSEN